MKESKIIQEKNISSPQVKRAIPRKKCFPENRIIIRIWTSKYNKSLTGHDVGHISIETKNAYISLWPKKDESDNLVKAMMEKREPDFLKGYALDEKKEERKPEFTVCLYSLSMNQMEEKFEELKTQVQHWTVLGNNILWSKTEQHSCASAAYEILIAGGFLDLLTNASTFNVKFSSVVSPDQLQLAAEAAKGYEVEKWPETASEAYKFSSPSTLGEPIPETIIKQKEPLTLNRYLIWTRWQTVAATAFTLGAAALSIYFYTNDENSNNSQFKL